MLQAGDELLAEYSFHYEIVDCVDIWKVKQLFKHLSIIYLRNYFHIVYKSGFHLKNVSYLSKIFIERI